MKESPLLGLATTEELLREVIARFTTTMTQTEVVFHATGQTYGNVARALILAEMLGGLNALDREYRTAEPRDVDAIEHIHIWADIPPLTSQLCSCGATRKNEKP
jgi:hypothetical protein